MKKKQSKLETIKAIESNRNDLNDTYNQNDRSDQSDRNNQNSKRSKRSVRSEEDTNKPTCAKSRFHKIVVLLHCSTIPRQCQTERSKMATFYMGRSVFLGHFVKRIIPARNCNVMYFCTKPEKNFTSVMLKSRGHIEVFGEDSVKFLHGLLTNDVNLFHADSLMNVLYAMMLNTKGRVLYDLMLFKQRKETAGFLIECDFNAVEDIIKTFKPYKLRSKVTFNDVTDRYRSWAIIDEGAIEGLKQKNMDSAILVEDPRQPLLGARLVLPREGRPMDYFSNIEESSDQGVYDEHRVKLGVPEGIKDFEPGTPMPLEFNITDLHGGLYTDYGI